MPAGQTERLIAFKRSHRQKTSENFLPKIQHLRLNISRFCEFGGKIKILNAHFLCRKIATARVVHLCTPCPKKQQNCFCQDVKCQPTLIIFGTHTAQRTELCEVH